MQPLLPLSCSQLMKRILFCGLHSEANSTCDWVTCDCLQAGHLVIMTTRSTGRGLRVVNSMMSGENRCVHLSG